jgi:hypothetical protein
MTVPAIPAIPVLISANNSPRSSRVRYGRIKSGASIKPTKMWTAAPRPSGPPTPTERRNTHANPWTMRCRTPQ